MISLITKHRFPAFLALVLVCGSTLAAPKTWTLNGVTTENGATWTGTFDYDADTNTYSSVNIVTNLTGAPNPWNTVVADPLGAGCPDPATASGVTVSISPTAITIFCMDFASPLTNSGGTINLLTGDIGWATLGSASDIASGSVSAPTVTWTLNNVTTDDGANWWGTFDYDATTNAYSQINITTDLAGAPNPWNTVSTDAFLVIGCPDPASASGVTVGFNAEGVTIFCMDFASPLTNSGGTVNLLTGDYGWATYGVSSVISSGYLTGVGLPALTVDIDIKPGSGSNIVHPHHNDVDVSPYLDDTLEVGVLGAMTSVGDPIDFDTDDIDPATLAFGPGAGAIDPASAPQFNQNVDNDGIDDATFEFLMSDSGLSCGETSATLTGETTSGQAFEGVDTIQTDCDAQCHN